MIAVGITIYNPTVEQIERINLFSKKFKVFVFQNSNLCKPLDPTIITLGDKKNEGISKALNQMMKTAFDNGYKYILFFDQDTSFQNFKPENVLDFLKEFKNKRLGALGMRMNESQNNDIISPYLLTSGTIYDLAKSIKIGGFDEKLFIDEVDIAHHHELHKNGYFCLSLKRYYLEHPIGEKLTKIYFGQKISSSNHSYIRRYYMARNRLYVYRKYREFETRNILAFTIIEPLRIFLVERKRFKKIKYLLLGYVHYYKKKFYKLKIKNEAL